MKAHRTKKLRRAKSGFTLLELLLVLTLIVVLYSLSIPALRQPMATQRLRKAADVVRSEWTRTRVRAMRSGRAHVFQYELAGIQYRVQAWVSPDDMVEAADASLTGFTENISTSAKVHEVLETLPEGVTVTSSKNKDSRSWTMADDPFGLNQGSEEWSTPPIFFYPDGTTSTAELVLTNDYGNQVTLKLRGLTGLVEVTDVVASSEVLQ